MVVLVAGGGIAGLTVALTCHQVGVSVQVFEAAPELKPLGLGINLQPDAVRELVELGLADELAAIAVETQELVLVATDGTEIWSEPRGRDAGYRWPQYSVHRGLLEMLLYRAVLDRLGPDAVHTGRSVTRYEHTRDAVRVELATSDGAIQHVDGEVLLGADGLHSAVRAQMFPGEGGPRWGGSVLWRGRTPGPSIRDGGAFVVIGDSAKRFVTFPISEPDPDTGHQMQNWIAEVAFDASRGWRRGDWNTRVSKDEFVHEFDGWSFGWLDVADMVDRSEIVFEYPMVDRDPVDHWVHGSVALIGDAAHAMYPVGSNGASQAIVDARVLGAAFVDQGVGRDALRAYESTLLESRSALVLRNRALGPGSVLGGQHGHLASAFGDLTAARSDQRARFIHEYRMTSDAAVDRLNSAASTIRI
jgi:2-polyprenyl-6-methoxyphenol hydroxylase-like FAD-dependent oxidoreductase